MKISHLIVFFLASWLLPTLVQSQTITISMNTSPAYCQSGYKDGRLFLNNVSGGTAPYTYLWSNGKTKANLDSLTAGTYSLTVTDALGITKVASGAVTQSQGLQMSATVNSANCDGLPIGGIALNNPNVHTPHTFRWSNLATTQTISNLPTGIYTVTATDKFGCSEKATYEIKKEFDFDVNPLSPPCANFTTYGVSNEKGTPPYTYLWSSGQTGQTIVAPPLQFQPIYSVTVTDSKGCSKSKDVPVIISTSTIVSQTIKPTDCDKADGSITLGFAFEPVKYVWSTGAITKNISNLKPGTYILTVTSPASCTSVFSFNVLGNIDINIKPNIACNATSGTLTASVIKGGVPPYQYAWSNGTITAVINSPVNTIFVVTVTDVKGCRAVKQANPLKTEANLKGSGIVDYSGCPHLKTAFLNGTPPYFDTWQNGDSLELTYLVPGNYPIPYTDSKGCVGTIARILTINDFAPKNFYTKQVCGNSAELKLKCLDSKLAYKWDNGAVTYRVTGLSKGKHYVTVTDTIRTIVYVDTLQITSDSVCSFLRGVVKRDANNNCVVDNGETPLENEIIEILPGPFFTKTDKNGAYFVALPAGNYTINVEGKNIAEKPCQLAIPISISDTSTLNIPMRVALCPYMEVYVSTPFLRRCFDNNYVVGYCNTGAAVAKNASIKLTLDKHLNYVSSTVTPSSQTANTLIFNVGDVAVGECKNFSLTLNLNCNTAILGETHCVEAHIFPDSLCLPTSPQWSGAKVQADAKCTGAEVSLTLKNTGTAPMIAARKYIIIEDQVIYKQGTFKLNPNEIFEMKTPANGKTYRIEAEQETGFPLIPSAPSAWAEACGTNPQGGVSTGFAPMYGNNGAQPFLAIDCHQSIGSYDPNEKTAYPIGYGTAHVLPQNAPIDYSLHFQNEGTDTAFTVVLRDTLSNLLNINTLRMGASSHPYTWNLSGKGVLTVTFNKINLTTKKQDEAKSQGFVNFRIMQENNVPLGSVIKNRAGIYFDFNKVIMTNEVFHTIGKDFIPMKVKTQDLIGHEVKIFPNPLDNEATFEVLGLDNQAIEFDLYDIRGTLLRHEKHNSNIFQFQKGELTNGLYFYQIKSDNLMISTGRLSIF